MGVPIRLLHAVEVDHGGSDPLSVALHRARRRAPAVRLSGAAVHEDAATALVGAGRNAFALVLGSSGLGDLAGLLLGSVSLAVAARADCPVVVVRGGSEHRQGRYGSVGVEDGRGQRHGGAVRVQRGAGAALSPGGGARLERPRRQSRPLACPGTPSRPSGAHPKRPCHRRGEPAPGPADDAGAARSRPDGRMLLEGCSARTRDHSTSSTSPTGLRGVVGTSGP
ncbi:universal stress protein [Streptomyces sp. NRRL S-118]|uniref:universal stress protein n=1 Tax=Streptomyces sp. NRRL S-118 TaxID=1463881 RepID=UPI002D21A3DC|nr:universal stress protein [Streptomyces sp. NRRL S-118]